MKKRTMNETHDAECGVAATAELIAAKWTPLIVHDLSEGPRRFMHLEHACPGISPRTLSERLHMLEHEGIVVRHSYPESPPRVEYELTDKGKALLPIINAMRRFGHTWLIRSAVKTPGNSGPEARRAPSGTPRASRSWLRSGRRSKAS